MRSEQQRGPGPADDPGAGRRGLGLLGVSAPWLPVGIGVVIMIALFLAASLWRPSGDLDPPLAQPTFGEPLLVEPSSSSPSPGGSPVPGVGSTTIGPATQRPPSTSGGAGATLPADVPGPPAPRPTRAAPKPPAVRPAAPPAPPAPGPARPPAPVTGTYRLLNTYVDSFIGEVNVANRDGRAVNWQVRLELPSGVGELRASWTEGFPSPAVRRSGQTVVFTSAATVPAGSSAPLRFHFARSGSASAPSACTVNGNGCGGIR